MGGRQQDDVRGAVDGGHVGTHTREDHGVTQLEIGDECTQFGLQLTAARQ